MQSIREFALVKALATHRHFGRAAAALGVSQPSLTRSLNRIEETVGGALFDRAGVTPTLFGAMVLKHGQIMMEASAELRRDLALAKGLDVGELSVAMGFFPADVSGHAAAGILTQRHPHLSLELRAMDWQHAKDAVMANVADLAFADIRAASASADFDVYPVRSGPLTFFCSAGHPLARNAEATFEDLCSFPWAGPRLLPAMSAAISGPRPCCVVDKASGWLRPRILVESFAAAKAIVLSGAAVSAGLPIQLQAELAAGDLVLLPPLAPAIDINYGFIVKRGRTMSPAAKAFMRIVREVEAALGRSPPKAVAVASAGG